LKPVVVSSYTRAEISKAAFWYESRKEGLGDQFLIDRTIDRIQINPDGYQPVYKAYRRAVFLPESSIKDIHRLGAVVQDISGSIVGGCVLIR
jgi:hypothetical protein